MIKRISLLMSLLAAFVGLYAEEVPALIIGGGTKVALANIVSVKVDADNLYVLQADGTTLTNPLATLTFGTVDSGAGISERIADKGPSSYIVYDLNGRQVKQGTAQDAKTMMSGLEAGTYIIRMGEQSFKVQTQGGGVSNAWQPLSYKSTYTAAAADDDDDTPEVTEPAVLFELSGIDAMTTIAMLDSFTLGTDLATLNVKRNGQTSSFAIADIQQISFPMSQAHVSLQYGANSVEGVNPFYFDGVAITCEGAGVTVNSAYTADEVEFQLSGASSNGFFKYYGDKKFQTTLMGLTLTNPVGPVINGQTGKKCTIKSQRGYTNTLSDGSEYATSVEDQKGCIFSEGQIIFNGKGTLNILSNYKHAIASDDYVSFENGNVSVLTSVGDAVHANDSVLILSGNVSLTCSGDGIDCEYGTVFVREGENGAPTLTINSDGDGAKGIKAAGDFQMSAGTVNITMTGNKKVENGNSSNVIGIKVDGNVVITGGTVNIVNTCSGGKYIKADGTITIGSDATVNY